MRIIISSLLILAFVGIAQADSINAKIGYADYLVEGLDGSPRVELGYEFNPTIEIPFSRSLQTQKITS